MQISSVHDWTYIFRVLGIGLVQQQNRDNKDTFLFIASSCTDLQINLAWKSHLEKVKT